ncbi:MAG TPA: hypothetical protein VF656_12585 [Pyrinomonadaceae bacterium]|jgi:hypothetical protein
MMDNESSFLSEEEQREYQEVHGGVQRSVIEIPVKPVEADAWQKTKAETYLLASYLVKQIGKLVDRHEKPGSASVMRKWFGCACIEIKEDDGMTWSAEAVNLKLEEAFPRFRRFCLASYKDNHSLPLISSLIGVRRFLKLAATHKLGTLSVFSGRWPTPVIIGAALLLGVFIRFLDAPQGNPSSKTTYFTLLVSVALGLASQYVITHLTDRTTPKKIEKFNAELEKILNEGSEQKYDRFIDSLASSLQSADFPRFVIIDDYERLDQTTKSVIQRYFEKYVPRAAGSEYWVVFEGQDGDKFSNRITEGQRFEAYKESRILQQQLLDEEERRRLVERFNRPLEALNYQAVKLVCKDTTKGKERIQKIAERYRRDHPKETRFGDLEFLYLLSLTATRPGNFCLTDPDLISRLTDSTAVRADVLRQFLHVPNLGLNEFRNRFKSVPEAFPNIAISREGYNKKDLFIIPETSALGEQANTLDLPRPGLGHLFWSLYWYNKLKNPLDANNPPEAFLMRKLNHHLKEAELATAAGADTDKRILNELFDALIFAVDASLKTGVFEDVTPLLEKAPYLLEMGDLAGSRSHQTRLAKHCWEAYSVLGRDEILGVMFDLYALPGRQVEVKEEKEDLLETLFFESLPLSPARRATLMTDFLYWTGGARQTVESVSHYARVRSAWLALSISPVVANLSATKLHQTVQLSDATITDLTRKALARIDSKSEESARITDIATLSLALWCNALRFHPDTVSITDSNHVENFKVLIELATDAVIKASYIRKEAAVRSGKSLRMDFLSSGLARELYAVAIASIITANQYLVRQGVEVLDKALLDEINELFKFSDEIFDYSLSKSFITNQYLTSSELVKKVDGMLNFCSIIWNRFGLRRLLEFTNIRRVHFNAICLGVNYARKGAYESLLESVGVAINDKGFTGLITNLVIADCLRQAGEIEAYYLRQAGLITVEGNFGSQFQQELSFAVVNEIHNLGYDLDIFLKNVLQEHGRDENFLLSLLKQLPQDLAPGRVLALFNAPNPQTPSDITGKLEETIASYVQQLQPTEGKRRVDALLRYFSLQEKIRRNEPLDRAEILSSWAEMKDLPVYAGVLKFIIKHDSVSPEVFRESLTILDHDPVQDNLTTYLFLAMELANHYLDSKQDNEDDKAILIRYLRNGANKWKSRMTALTNLEIYQLLLSLDAEEAEYYFSEIQNWQYVHLRRTQLERLPQLVAEGQFFLIFSDYTFTMRLWGLELDIEPEEFSTYLNASAEKKREHLVQWQNSYGETPAPLVDKNLVSGKFIYLGQYLFGAPHNQDPAFHEARTAFNQAAYYAMSELLDLITNLPALPDTIKELLQTYSKSFFYNPDSASNN